MKISNKNILKVVENLAHYHANGAGCIDKAYNIFAESIPTCTAKQFRASIDIEEIDEIGFLYDTAKENWSSDTEMIQWGQQTFSHLIN